MNKFQLEQRIQMIIFLQSLRVVTEQENNLHRRFKSTLAPRSKYVELKFNSKKEGMNCFLPYNFQQTEQHLHHQNTTLILAGDGSSGEIYNFGKDPISARKN